MDGSTLIEDPIKFKASLPGSLSPWAYQLLAAGSKNDVSPWLLAGIIYRESAGGEQLQPRGARGTGDFHPRPMGRRYANGYSVKASGMPEDGQGWGRGLAQIDWAVHYDWCNKNDWGDPVVNLAYAGELLSGFLEFFKAPASASGVHIDGWRAKGLTDARGVELVAGWTLKYGILSLGPFADPRPLSGSALIRAALSAYNAGTSGVLQALAAQLPADAPTAHNDYASWTLERVNLWEAKYR